MTTSQPAPLVVVCNCALAGTGRCCNAVPPVRYKGGAAETRVTASKETR